MLSDDVDDSKFVQDVYVPSKNGSIIEDISVGSGTPFLTRATCLLIVPVMT